MQIGVTGKGTEYILTRHKDAKDAIRPIYPSPLAGEGRGEGEAGFIPHFNTYLRQEGRGAEGDLKRAKESVMPDLMSLPRNGYGGIQEVLKRLKDPARLQWHEVHPEQCLIAAKRLKKVDH